MPDLTREEIKAILVTDAVPTQAQWHAIVDSLMNKIQAATDAAEAAGEDAEGAVEDTLARAARVFGHFKFTYPAWAAVNLVGASVVHSGGFSATLTITFDTPFADTHYSLFFSTVGADNFPVDVTVTAKTVNSIVVSLAGPNAAGEDGEFQFAIFR